MDYERAWNEFRRRTVVNRNTARRNAEIDTEDAELWHGKAQAYDTVLNGMDLMEGKQGIEYEYQPFDAEAWDKAGMPKGKPRLIMHHDDSMDKLKERVEKLERRVGDIAIDASRDRHHLMDVTRRVDTIGQHLGITSESSGETPD